VSDPSGSDEAIDSDDDSDDSNKLQEKKIGKEEEDDRPDEYEGQALNAKELTWAQMARKHYQAFSLLQGQFSGYNSKHIKAIRNLGGDTKSIDALKDDFCGRTSQLQKSLALTLKKAHFCEIMNFHNNDDEDSRDRFLRRPAQLPDAIQAGAIGTLSLRDELRSDTRPNPLPPDVTEAATILAERLPLNKTNWADYPDILFSQRHPMAKCLRKPLSDYLPEDLSSIISGLDNPSHCHHSFRHIFEEINANPGLWAPNYPPATLPASWPPSEAAGSTQSGNAGNPQASYQQRYGAYSNVPPGGSGRSGSRSDGAPPQSSGTNRGRPPSGASRSGYNTTRPPETGGRNQRGGSTRTQYSARR
jgi:hypothetical protein